jgi:hypothetical protein
MVSREQAVRIRSKETHQEYHSTVAGSTRSDPDATVAQSSSSFGGMRES